MLDNTKHKVFMTQILLEIFKSDLSGRLAFKGGTLALLFYGLDRFSTDIDLDLTDPKGEEMILQKMPKVLGNILEVKNYTLGKDLHRRVCRYDVTGHNIKIELNKRITQSNIYLMQNYYGTDVRIMDKGTMVAHKLSALHDRVASRDLRDVYFFLKNMFPINQSVIQEKMQITPKELINKLIIQIPTKFNSQNILYVLGNVLTDKQKARVKNHLIDETIIQLRILQDNL